MSYQNHLKINQMKIIYIFVGIRTTVTHFAQPNFYLVFIDHHELNMNFQKSIKKLFLKMILGNLECMGWISPPPINIQNACTIRVKNGNFYKQYCLGLMHSHSHAFSTPCKVLKINLLQTLKHLSPQHSHLSKNKRVHLFLVCTLVHCRMLSLEGSLWML